MGADPSRRREVWLKVGVSGFGRAHYERDFDLDMATVAFSIPYREIQEEAFGFHTQNAFRYYHRFVLAVGAAELSHGPARSARCKEGLSGGKAAGSCGLHGG